MELSRELVQRIVAHMSCHSHTCENCELNGIHCAIDHEQTENVLKKMLEAAEIESNAPETAETTAKAMAATEYITITVAEYHWLTKTATMLEMILADDTYSHAEVVAAARKTVEEMKSLEGIF